MVVILLALATHVTRPYARPCSQEYYSGGNPGRFFTDITKGPFPWWSYLQSQPWGRDIYKNGIDNVMLVLLRNDEGAFRMETKTGGVVVITPGKRCELHIGDHEATWR